MSSSLHERLHALGIEAVQPWLETRCGPAFVLHVPSDRSLELWDKLTKALPEVGYWPLIVGSPDDEEFIREISTEAHQEQPPVDLAAAERLDVLEWVRGRITEIREDLESEESYPIVPADASGDEFALDESDDEEDDEDEELESLALEYEVVSIGLVPAEKPYHVHGVLEFGNWNEYPDPAVMVAIQQYWFDHFGAVPMALTGDVMEWKLSKPVKDRATARAMATWFVAMSTEMMMDSQDELAAALHDTDFWTIWWD